MTRKLSLHTKILLWFFVFMLVIAAFMFLSILYISKAVKDRDLQAILVKQVEDNIDEVEYYQNLQNADMDYDRDIYIVYQEGYLEIDDDYLDIVNNIYTSLYNEKKRLLYGENPIRDTDILPEFSDKALRKIRFQNKVFFIYDRALQQPGTRGLWLRGIVSEEANIGEVYKIASWSLIFMPLIICIALIGGYFISKKAMQPIGVIRSTAVKISEGGDLKQRIEIGDGEDELHKLARVFNAMFARLQKAFEAEKRFSADASHELRLPMSVIMAQCEYTLSQERDIEEYREALGIIFRQGKKMSRLISDMLEFFRMESGYEQYIFSSLSLSELVEDVCKDMVLLKLHNIKLHYDIEKNLCIRGNRELLGRMMENIIGNAYKYGKEDGEIWVELKAVGKQARFSVKDNGRGMREEETARIFERFYQCDSSRSDKGTGLGLPMAKEIAGLHNTAIEVESRQGRGSEFTIFFQLLQEE